MVATGGRDKDIRTWDLYPKPCCSGRLEGHESSVLCLSVSEDGWRIASGGDSKKGDINGVMKLWELTGDRYECSYTYRTHEKEVRAVAITKDGFIVASGSKDGTIHVFKVGQGGVRKPTAVTDPPHKGAVRGLDFHPYFGSWLVSVSEDSTTRVYNSNTGHTIHILRGSPIGSPRAPYLSHVVWSPCGNSLLTTGYDSLLRTWRWHIGEGEGEGGFECVDERQAHDGNIHQVSYAGDGTVCATSAEDGTVRLWNTAALLAGEGAAALIDTLDNGDNGGKGGTLSGAVFLQGSRSLSVASNDSRIRVWKLPPNLANPIGGLMQGPAPPTPKAALRTSAEVFVETRVAPSSASSSLSLNPSMGGDKVGDDRDLGGWKTKQTEIRQKKKAEWEKKQAAFEAKVGPITVGTSFPPPSLLEERELAQDGTLGATAPGQKLLLCGGARRQCGCIVS